MNVVLRLVLVLVVLSAVAVASPDDEEVEVEVEQDGPPVEKTLLNHEKDDVAYVSPTVDPAAFFAEHFDDTKVLGSKWIKSKAKKQGIDIDAYEGEWAVEQALKNPLAGDLGLVLKSKAKHSAVSARLKKPFKFEHENLIVQYEINFQEGQDCGGGYLKLLSQSNSLDLNKFDDKTPYTIMFGPDRCGSDSKLHLIFRHVNPKNQSVEEKHCKKLDTKERAILEELFKDNRPHLLRLEMGPDNTYEISIDYKIVNHGSLFTDFTPPVNPPAEIEDSSDRKPEDWDEREKIPDPAARKPDDWDETQPRQILDEDAAMPDAWLEDEPESIPDSTAVKPDDWDDEMDGMWEAPMIDNPRCKEAPGCGKWKRPLKDNPKFKGKWVAPLINNPNYKGKWKPRMIPNPDYFHDPEPFRMTAIAAVGIELWTMSNNIYFDNLLITNDRRLADAWAKETFDLKVQKLDANSANLVQRIITYSNRNPWLYAVYVVVVGLPLVLVITFCCSGSGESSSKAKAAEDQHPKKTDELQNDDDKEEVEEDEDEEEQDQGGGVEDDGDEEPDEKTPLQPSTPSSKSAGPRKRKARRD